MISKEKFSEVTKIVIDKLEGGYWNPKYHGVPSGYENSGETMFGIDRVAGGSINDSAAGKKFWALIDKNNNPQVWKWNYLGGSLNPQLKQLATEVMYPVYVDDTNRYLSKEAQKIVDSDPRLIFHFSYASWNGMGWFQKFAKQINDAVASGIKDTDKLVDIAVKSRAENSNSLIKQGGQKIAGFIDDLKTQIKGGTDIQTALLNKIWSTTSGKIGIILVVIGAVSLTTYLVLKNKE